MKKLLIFVLAMATMTGCSLLQKSSNSSSTSTAAPTATTTTTTATTAGNGAGQALLGLYNQYKADGKYDYKNISNISNTLLLLANITELPSNIKNTTYLKEFGQGMMLSATSLITTENVEAITNSLSDIAVKYTDKAASTASTAAEKLTTAAESASSIATLLSMFGK